MRRGMRTALATGVVLLFLAVAGDRWLEGQAQSAPPVPAQTAAAKPVSPQRALIDQYCLGCHNDRLKSGGLALSASESGRGRPERRDSRESDSQAARRSHAAGRRQASGASRGRRIRLVAREQDRRRGVRRANRDAWHCDASIAGSTATPYAICSGSTSTPRHGCRTTTSRATSTTTPAALQVSPNFIDQYIYAARAVALEAIGNPKAPAGDDDLRRRRQHGDFPAAGWRSGHRQAAASH